MNDTSTLKIGQIVTSIAGRDKQKVFIVIDVVDEQYVKVVDGDLRRIERPKLKKVKHLNISNQIAEKVRKASVDGTKLTNEKIRKILENFTF